jgi:hypothetical protein
MFSHGEMGMSFQVASVVRRGLSPLFLFCLTIACIHPAFAADAGDKNAPAPEKLGDFTVLGSTNSGKTLFLKLPSATSVEAAITQTADALGNVCDGKPNITGAFANAQSKDKGGATLTAKLKGTDIRGLILCGVTPSGGSSITVIALANTSKEDFAKLMAFIPAPIKLTPHQFPDGSGTIGLPDGWTTQDSTATYGIHVQGPAGQAVVFNGMSEIYEPNSLLVRQSRQTYQIEMQTYNMQMQQYRQALAMHQQFPNTLMPKEPTPPKAPDPDPNVQYPAIPFCQECHGAEDVLKYWYPIAEQKARRRGGPYTSLDRVIEVLPAAPNPYEKGSAAGVAYIAVTDHTDTRATPVRVINRISTAPIMQGECWQLAMSIMRAPDVTFDRDLPVMNAIMSSIQLNMDVVNHRMAADGAAIRQMGEENEQRLLEQGREFRQQMDDQFNRFEERMAAQQQAMHDSASDTIEYIRGVRDVYDTQTGQMISVDLFNVNGIVAGMNDAANDPNRFVQIPLRYER